MKILTSLIVISLMLLTSCSKPKVVYKTKIVYKECPKIDLQPPPKASKFKVYKVVVDKDLYYCVDLDNAKTMAENWINFKDWCSSLQYNIKLYQNQLKNR